MYAEHPELEHVEDALTIWRYMNFTKFVHLLSTNSLFFARTDTLGDHFEGALPRPVAEKRRDAYRFSYPGAPDGEYERLGRLEREFVAVNCWHMSEHESAAMWSLYLDANEGVALRSTVGRFKASFDATDLSHIVYLATIRYIDYGRDTFEPHNQYTRFLYNESPLNMSTNYGL